MNCLKYSLFFIVCTFSHSDLLAQDSLAIAGSVTVGRINTDELTPNGISVLDLRVLEKEGALFSFFPRFINEAGQNIELTDKEFEQLSVKVVREPNIGFDLEKDPQKKSVDIGMRPFSCECFTTIGPDSAVYELSVPLSDKTREINVTAILLTNIKDVSLWLKCHEFILYTLLVILLAIYIVGIIRKPRFGVNAYILYSRNQYLSPGRGKKYALSTNFVNKWLVPYFPERKMVQGVLFEAGSTESHIYLTKKSQKKNMIAANNEILRPGSRKIKILHKQYVENEAGSSKVLYEYNRR